MRINEVIPLSNYTLRIVADEGVSGIFDVAPYLKYEAFQPLQKISEFMKISNGGYFVEWECGADLSADTIETKMKL
ncbi:DUF2442 domain-containing protein [candidate division KSB1 bacterium]|nr:DUF2442 domain-containing protein [candidate division KSB1 bacterium]MBL7095593.1 DUF2442 domain-containing protein [candidate division KSB1 bacterium]